jgi:transcriptional regulator with XRE-family HTH domain
MENDKMMQSKGGIMDGFPNRLEDARRRKVLTQDELATKAGVSPVTIHRLETGVNKDPRPATIRKLAEALGVDAGWLLFGDESDSKLAA